MAVVPKHFGQTCTMKMLKAGVYKSDWKETTTDSIKEGFEESVDFRLVYRNMNYNITYKTWIYEGNASEKTVGYLHLMSYPYDEVKFDIGDYIQFNYRHLDEEPQNYKFWILQSLDTRHLYNVHGRLLPCNQTLKWKSNGVVYNYPCYFNTEMTKTNILDSNQGFNVESGALIAIVQQNENTRKIFVNQRFMLNGRTYVVYQFNDNVDEGLLYVYLRLTAELPEDDFDNNIAYNGISINEEVLDGDIINLNEVENVRQNESMNIDIYNYDNGTLTGDIFDVTTTGVPVENFDLQKINGNKFVLTNLKRYTKNPLKLEFQNITTENIVTVYVWLGGAL